jgi:hypothetical protein
MPEDHDAEPTPTQRTQPKGKDAQGEPAKPIEIPVPKRNDFEQLLKRAEAVPLAPEQDPPS